MGLLRSGARPTFAYGRDPAARKEGHMQFTELVPALTWKKEKHTKEKTKTRTRTRTKTHKKCN
jgi:hypothetical protein